MIALGRSTVPLRFCALVAFLGYLCVGASLALPAEPRCARCAKIGGVDAVKPGASCPLLSHGHHCHHGVKKTPNYITLCPDGCLRHDEQGGEIPSLAKLLSTYPFYLPGWLLAQLAI